jgi:hypothetical protein
MWSHLLLLLPATAFDVDTVGIALWLYDKDI